MIDVTIVGAGVSGVRAAKELDDRNVTVLLIEKNFYIGGRLTELSRIYPVCELYYGPRFFFQLNDSPNVEILTGSEVEEIDKGENSYKVRIKRRPRYVNEKCTLCLKCVDACEKEAVKKPPFQSVPQIVYVEREKCGDCRLCEEICPEDAFNLDEKEEILERETGDILFFAGAELFDAEKYVEYGYKRFPDVITSIELEKMLHPSFETRFCRPSDGKRPEKIAFLQCIGSRDYVKGEPYCSKICCMQALNEAKIIKERYPGTEITIFFTDVQCSGKRWEQFYEKTRKMGVSCIRFRASSIYEEEGNVCITYAEDRMMTKQVDLAVLSVGISPHADTEKFGLPVDELGFPGNGGGFFLHPADITESVEDALAVVSRISGKDSEECPMIAPEPGLQIFLCSCRSDLSFLADSLRKEGHPIHVSDCLCSRNGIEEFLGKLKKEKIVMGGCSLHEDLFRTLIRRKGFTSFLEVVPLREMKWVTSPESLESSMRIAVAKIRKLDISQIKRLQTRIVPEVAVIGGGIAGLTAALELADTFRVSIIEKSPELGGRARKIHFSLDYSPEQTCGDLMEKVLAHPNITVLTGIEITGLTGHIGDFLLITSQNEIKCGAVIVAVGADEYVHEYYHPKIITQTELEERILEGDLPHTIVMIQCVGSRTDENSWCSAVCCSKAVSNSLQILEKKEAQIVILYRDMRTYGFADTYYRKAREKGVLFLQNDEMPTIRMESDSVLVEYKDPILNAKIEIEPDLIVLSTGVIPKRDSHNISQILGIGLDENGFFRELHPKFYPVDSTREGIFLCGQCHSPRNVKESITQAKAAASRVRTLFSSRFIDISTKIAVREDLCTGCSTCIEMCPFKAIFSLGDEKKTVQIDMSNCRDCGLCVGSCPVSALSQATLSDVQLLSMVEGYYE